MLSNAVHYCVTAIPVLDYEIIIDNYFVVRFGRRPIFVDLDVGQGSISIPGTIGAVLVERIASIREGFSMEAPLVYQLGHVSPSSNLTLYNVLIKQLSSAVHAKMDSNKKGEKLS